MTDLGMEHDCNGCRFYDPMDGVCGLTGENHYGCDGDDCEDWEEWRLEDE